MRPGVAGEKFKGVGEALGQIDGQAMVSGIAAGQLRIYAVERDGYAETRGVPRHFRESHLSGITDSGIASASGGCERRIWARRAEEIEKCRSANKLAVERGDRATE